MGGNPTANTPSVPAEVRCVVMLPDDGARPPDLERSFAARRVKPAWARGPYAAFAELCALTRDADADAPAGPPALVIVEPDGLPRDLLERLLDAAARYTPRSPVWRYDRAGSPRLRALTQSPRAMREPPAPRTAPAKPAPLRLAGDGPAVAEPGEHEPLAVRVRPSALLTEEELAMLLADDPAPVNGNGNGAKEHR